MNGAELKNAAALVGVWVTLLGCSDGGNPTAARGGASSGLAGESGMDAVGGDSSSGGAGGDSHVGNAGGSDGNAGAAELGGIFTTDSDSIEIDWFNFFDGGYRFARRRDQLSTEQLERAEAIKVVPTTDACLEDATGMLLTVTAGDTKESYRANEDAGDCSSDSTMVDFKAVTALLDTVHCLPSQGYDGSSAQTAPSIVPDDGCWHGLFNFVREQPSWWFRIEIPAAGEYRILLDDCNARSLHLALFEADATTAIASVSDNRKCAGLTHIFADPGSYALRVEMVSGTTAGDFFLALESTSNE